MEISTHKTTTPFVFNHMMFLACRNSSILSPNLLEMYSQSARMPSSFGPCPIIVGVTPCLHLSKLKEMRQLWYGALSSLSSFHKYLTTAKHSSEIVLRQCFQARWRTAIWKTTIAHEVKVNITPSSDQAPDIITRRLMALKFGECWLSTDYTVVHNCEPADLSVWQNDGVAVYTVIISFKAHSNSYCYSSYHLECFRVSIEDQWFCFKVFSFLFLCFDPLNNIYY